MQVTLGFGDSLKQCLGKVHKLPVKEHTQEALLKAALPVVATLAEADDEARQVGEIEVFAVCACHMVQSAVLSYLPRDFLVYMCSRQMVFGCRRLCGLLLVLMNVSSLSTIITIVLLNVLLTAFSISYCITIQVGIQSGDSLRANRQKKGWAESAQSDSSVYYIPSSHIIHVQTAHVALFDFN